jgi:hypothetical protein
MNPAFSNTNITYFQIAEAQLYYCSDAYTNFHKTWYVYHAILGHLNGIFHKFLPSVIQTLHRLKYNNIVTCQPFVGLRNGAWLGSRPVNNSSAQPR